MFTGIIEEQGIILRNRPGSISGELMIKANRVLENTSIGDSIAVNGVCLTVTSILDNQFSADVMLETLKRTNLGDLKTGASVNLERALTPQSRLGGHIVSGHIDGRGEIVNIRPEQNAVWYTIKTTPEILRGLIEKGSIAIDGISLTVVTVGDAQFTVSIIPHTMAETTLGKAEKGMIVNLETDLLGKYVLKYMQFKQPDTVKNEAINLDFLAMNGFV